MIIFKTLVVLVFIIIGGVFGNYMAYAKKDLPHGGPIIDGVEKTKETEWRKPTFIVLGCLIGGFAAMVFIRENRL